jgi:hypothetical protein
MESIVANLPDDFSHIRPLFGTVLEIRFDTVGNVLYGVVIEETPQDRWTVCYVARSYGFELLWMFRSVERSVWEETMGIREDGVVDVALTEDPDEHMLVVTKEVDWCRTLIFYRVDDQGDAWMVFLVVQFDLNVSINWAAEDDNSAESDSG